MRVVVTNTVALNGGDAAILEGIRVILSRRFGRDVVVAACDSQPEVAARLDPGRQYLPLLLPGRSHWFHRRLVGPVLRGLRATRLRWAARCLRRGLRLGPRLLVGREDRRGLLARLEADLVLSTGGTYLVETYGLEARLFELRIARLLGRPHALFTQSLGPFSRPEHRRSLRDLLGSAAFVLLRDERSRGHLLDLGLDGGNLHVRADAAFALADPERIARRIDTGLPPAWRRVAVSVRNWPYFRTRGAERGMSEFRREVAAFTTRLVEEHGSEVVFLSTCQGVPEYWTDDAAVAREIVELLPQGVRARVRVDAEFRRPRELVEELGRQDLVVATRMHAAILASCAGTPVLPIAYEFKTEELFAGWGLGDLVQPMEGFTAEGAWEALGRLGRLGEDELKRVFDAVLEARDDALASAEHVREVLGDGRDRGPSRLT